MEKGNLTIEEVKKLFECSDVWDNKVIYLACRLSACSGLRISELSSLCGDCVFDNYLYIQRIYKMFRFDNQKTYRKHYVPIASFIKNELEELSKANGSGFVFSEDGGKTQISDYKIKKHFRIALEKIGIKDKEIRDRRLIFHSLRHFYLSVLDRYKGVEFKSVTKREINLNDYYLKPDKRLCGIDEQTGIVFYK